MSTVSGSFERVEQQAPVRSVPSIDIFPLEFILLCSITATIVWLVYGRLKRKT